MYQDNHWRQSALNSAGALQGGGGEFPGIFTPFYAINFRGAPAAPASSAPMHKISSTPEQGIKKEKFELFQNPFLEVSNGILSYHTHIFFIVYTY